MATKLAPAPTLAAGNRPIAPKARPYKDFLTPALHRSFTNAALIGLAVCWVEAIFMSKPSLFWSWFPLGFTGVRTGLLFISSLTIFILRVAQLHVRSRTHTSSIAALCDASLFRRFFWTALWYYMSAFLFSETYIFSTSQSANLSWVDPGRSYERPRLNERAVLLRTLFGVLAFAQAILHVYGDYDLLRIARPRAGASDRHQKANAAPKSELSAPTPFPLLTQMQKQLLPLAIRSIILTIVVAIWGTIIYFLFLRQTAWTIARNVGRMFFTINKSSTPSGLSDLPSLMGRFLFSATLLLLLWGFTNIAFDTFASQAPLKKGQPLTNDSKSPNGSLVSGLKAKREIPHSMALWELRLIAEQFEVRRKTIFTDFEKPNSSTWLDIVATCIAEIEGFQTRITASTRPLAAAPSASDPAPKARIAQPLQSDDRIFRPSPRPTSALEAVGDGMGTLAKSIGQSTGPNPLASKARGLLAAAPNPAPTGITGSLQAYALTILRSPLGLPFRTTFPSLLTAKVFGTPSAAPADAHNAARAIARLAVASLREDPFGQVQKDVARIMRALVAAIAAVQGAVRETQPHWTDVAFDGKRSAPEVAALLAVLKESLEDLVLAFGEYADGLGIGRDELRRAKEMLGQTNEMVKR